MDALECFVPKGAIPNVLYVDYVNHIYMMTCAKKESQTWKDILLNGNFSVPIAANVAHVLRKIHYGSHGIDAKMKTKFQDQKYFIQLRINPFHRYLMQKYPELSSSIQKLIDEVTLQKICLVHGDFSPRNILVERGNNIVLIDFEVAHSCNPVFNIAYCIGHLMLKGWCRKKHKEILKLIEIFLTVYGRQVKNLNPHLGRMLLETMDGKSPVNYVTDENMKNIIWKVAVNWIQDKVEETDTLKNIQKAFQVNF